MKSDELERLGLVVRRHIAKWGSYYFGSLLWFLFAGTITLVLMAPESSKVTLSDGLISAGVATLGFMAAALNQSIAWLRSSGDRREAKKLLHTKQVEELEKELGLHEQEVVH